MAVEEQISEVAAAPNSLTDSSLAGDDVAHKEQAAANGNASNGDAVGEEFGELDDLEAVDMSGGALMKHLPETEVNGHCDHHDGPLLCDTMPTLQPDMLPDLTERSSHLSASATPDKAREIDAITQRIAVLHEHLQKSNVSPLPPFSPTPHHSVCFPVCLPYAFSKTTIVIGKVLTFLVYGALYLSDASRSRRGCRADCSLSKCGGCVTSVDGCCQAGI